MSKEINKALSLSTLRLERAADDRRMVVARRAVVARARGRILPHVEAANDANPKAA